MVAMTPQDVAAACTVKDDGIPAGGPADDLIGACGGSDPQPAIGVSLIWIILVIDLSNDTLDI